MKELKQLISEKEKELQSLENSLGLGFPIIEQAKSTRICYLQAELENLRTLDEQPELNDNQKVVLEWLKDPLNDIPNRFAKDYFAYITCLFLGQAPERVIKSYRELSSEQQMQILSVWGLEQEGNSDGIN